MFAGCHDLNDHSSGCFLCSLHLFKEAQVARIEPGGGVEKEAGGCGPACISAESASCTVYSVLITWFDIFSQTLIVNHTGWWLLLADL